MPMVPEALGIDPLLLSVLHVDAFLQLSEDETVEPDAAVEATEHVGHYLGRLPPERVAAVRADLSRLAAFARNQKWPDELVDFFSEYWENVVGGDE